MSEDERQTALPSVDPEEAFAEQRTSVLPPPPEEEFGETLWLSQQILHLSGEWKNDQNVEKRPGRKDQDPNEVRPPRVDKRTQLLVDVLQQDMSVSNTLGAVQRAGVVRLTFVTAPENVDDPVFASPTMVETFHLPMVEHSPENAVHLPPRKNVLTPDNRTFQPPPPGGHPWVYNLPIATTDYNIAQLELPDPETGAFPQQDRLYGVYQACHLPTSPDGAPSISYVIGPLERKYLSLVESGSYRARLIFPQGIVFRTLGRPLWYRNRDKTFQSTLRIYDPFLPPLPYDLGFPLPGAEESAKWIHQASLKRVPYQVMNMWLDAVDWLKESYPPHIDEVFRASRVTPFSVPERVVPWGKAALVDVPSHLLY